MGEEPEITSEQWATFRRCTFARCVFASYPTLWAKTPMRADNLPPNSRDGGEWPMSDPPSDARSPIRRSGSGGSGRPRRRAR